MSSVVPEFHREFEAETGRLLRHRFWWFLASVGTMYVFFRSLSFLVYGVLSVTEAAGVGTAGMAEAAIKGVRFGRLGLVIVGALTVLDVGVMAWAGVRAGLKRPAPEGLSRLAAGTLLYLGLSHIAMLVMIREIGFPWAIATYHFLACVFLPWTPAQAVLPAVLLVLANAGAVVVLGEGSLTARTLVAVAGLFTPGPGVLAAWLRHSRRLARFRVKMLTTRYGQIRRELFDAQRIHESLFPRPVLEGPLVFDFRYQPMLQIGGDYLYARFSPPSRDGGERAFNLLLLDVTGHGIAAALTVNRLYGEVERLFAEDPHASPGDVLRALNRYVHLTLATHSVYVTALCMRIDPVSDRLEYASGGHPPAFVCRGCGGNGAAAGGGAGVERLDSTAFVLGACAGEDFDPCVETRAFGPGDTLVAYTDGALECRNHAGKMLGLAGMSKILDELHAAKAEGGGLAGALLSKVESHRAGPPEDDTLIVEVRRSAGVRGAGLSVERAGGLAGDRAPAYA